MTRYLYPLVLCLIVSFANAQDDVIQLVFTDVHDLPIEGVTVQIENNLNSISDEDGTCLLPISSNSDQILLQIKHVGFQDMDTLIRVDQIQNNKIAFELLEQIFEVPEILVKQQVENILEREHWLVLDMINYDENFLFISLQGNKRYLSVSSPNGTLKFEQKLMNKYTNFHKSCLGKIHLIGPNNCQEISSVNDAIVLAPVYARSTFDDHMLPCIYADEEGVIFQEWKLHNKLMKLHRINTQSQANLCLQLFDREAAISAQTIYRKIIGNYYRATHGDISDQNPRGTSENIIAEGFWDGDVRRLMESSELDRLVGYYLQVEAQPLSVKHFIYENDLYLVYFDNQEFIRVIDCDPKKVERQHVSGFNWEEKNPQFSIDDATGQLYLLDKNQVLKMENSNGRIAFTKIVEVPQKWHHDSEFIVHNESFFVLCQPEAFRPKHQLRQLSIK